MSISAFIPVFNEEKRIAFTLKTLQWCDEIIVLDKQSTDNTREIAAKFNAKVFIQENSSKYEVSELDFLKYCTSEWIVIFTASDIIHPKLAQIIKELADRKEFEYDFIQVPFYTYILGIDSERSPWHTELKSYVYRNGALEINKDGVHDAVRFTSNRIYKLKKSKEHCIYHLTHETVDTMMERHTRYWRGEAFLFHDASLKEPLKKAIKEFLKVIFRWKSFLMGWDGIMLSFAFLSYFMMSFVYKWEKKRGRASEVYDKIRNDLITEWEKAK
jgi:glycosyltransferase involved in cell wall biosynthesis